MATCERYPPKYPPACSTCSTWMALVIATLRISPRHRCSYLGFDGGDFIRDKPFDGVSKKRYKQYKKTTWVAEFFKKNQFVIYGINVIDPESTASVESQKNNRLFQWDAVAQSKSGFQKSKPTWRSLMLDGHTAAAHFEYSPGRWELSLSEIGTTLCHPCWF